MDEFIWVHRWDEFQTFQKKRGKPWAPPWFKMYSRILDDAAYLSLTPETRSLLVGIWTLFARSRLTVPKDTRYLSRQLHQKVLTRQLDSLNHAGFITFCSGTVLEQRRNAFWNGSTPEVEVEKEEETPPHPYPAVDVPTATATDDIDFRTVTAIANGTAHAVRDLSSL